MKFLCHTTHGTAISRCHTLLRSFVIAAMICIVHSSVRAVTITYNSPAADWVEIDPSQNPPPASGDITAKLCAQYVLETYANLSQVGGTEFSSSKVQQALSYLEQMENKSTSNSETYGNFAWSMQDTRSSLINGWWCKLAAWPQQKNSPTNSG